MEDKELKILITGNMGYIGPVLSRHLRETHPDAVLVGLDMGYFGNCITALDVLPECRMDVQYFGDVRDLRAEILEGVDTIVHLAAISNDPMGNKFEEITFEINHRASINLAEKAKEAGVKSFIFASSCSMYGEAAGKPKTENDKLNPLTAYAKSKVYTEKNLRSLADNSFTVTCLRYSTACGMSDRLRLDLVLNDFVACAVATKKITILSDGTPWRPLINVKDMARAIEWAIVRSTDDNRQFLAVNIGCDEWNYQVKDLADAVAQVMPDVEISINKDAAPDKRSYKVNFDLFKSLAPNYQPTVNLITSIKELKTGLEAMEFKDGNFRSSNYMRLMHLNHLMKKEIINDRLELVKNKS